MLLEENENLQRQFQVIVMSLQLIFLTPMRYIIIMIVFMIT